MVPLKIVSNVSRFKPALNLNRVLADLNRGSNSLNSRSDKGFKGTVLNNLFKCGGGGLHLQSQPYKGKHSVFNLTKFHVKNN